MNAESFTLKFTMLDVKTYCKSCMYQMIPASLNYGSDPLVIAMQPAAPTGHALMLFHVLNPRLIVIGNATSDMLYDNRADENASEFIRQTVEGSAVWRYPGLAAIYVDRGGIIFNHFGARFGDTSATQVPDAMRAALQAYDRMKEVEQLCLSL